MSSFNIQRITQVPIKEDTLYIIDIDDTLLRDDSQGKEQILHDANTNKWLAAIDRTRNSTFYVCTYRKPSGNAYTRAQFRKFGLTELTSAFVDYTSDKGDSIDNVISTAIDENGFNPWSRFIFIDDNPTAHEQVKLSRAFSVNPSSFMLYEIDPYAPK